MKGFRLLNRLASMCFFLACMCNVYTENYEVAMIDAVLVVALAIEENTLSKEKE